MIREEKDTRLEFLDNGVVNVVIITRYLKGENEIGSENWGCCLEPHPAHLEHARTFLSDYHIGILETAWTEEVISNRANSTMRH